MPFPTYIQHEPENVKGYTPTGKAKGYADSVEVLPPNTRVMAPKGRVGFIRDVEIVDGTTPRYNVKLYLEWGPEIPADIKEEDHAGTESFYFWPWEIQAL